MAYCQKTGAIKESVSGRFLAINQSNTKNESKVFFENFVFEWRDGTQKCSEPYLVQKKKPSSSLERRARKWFCLATATGTY
jgi:hypothetical protein